MAFPRAPLIAHTFIICFVLTLSSYVPYTTYGASFNWALTPCITILVTLLMWKGREFTLQNLQEIEERREFLVSSLPWFLGMVTMQLLILCSYITWEMRVWPQVKGNIWNVTHAMVHNCPGYQYNNASELNYLSPPLQRQRLRPTSIWIVSVSTMIVIVHFNIIFLWRTLAAGTGLLVDVDVARCQLHPMQYVQVIGLIVSTCSVIIIYGRTQELMNAVTFTTHTTQFDCMIHLDEAVLDRFDKSGAVGFGNMIGIFVSAGGWAVTIFALTFDMFLRMGKLERLRSKLIDTHLGSAQRLREASDESRRKTV
jgi:hypothetical protein